MARGQVTEEELSAGLKAVGNLQKLAGGSARRDSPFGSQHLKPKAGEGSSTPEVSEKNAGASQITEIPKKAATQRKTQRDERAASSPKTAPATSEFEDVTVPFAPSTRDAVGNLARELQRRRTEKRSRFTANVLIRVAVDHFLEHFELIASDLANDESELRELVRRKLSPEKSE